MSTKIQDEQEVIKWFEDGRTYAWMIQTYRDKYHIETSPSMWAMFRRRKGLPQRITRDDELIPWEVSVEHRWAYPVTMLRQEARRRSGRALTAEYERDLNSWIANLKKDGLVVHYDPDTEEGWFYVPARPGVDTDLIRVPERRKATRAARGVRRA